MGSRSVGSGKARRSSGVHVALLRGINVGGKNKLLMTDLVAMFADAGCREVRTYIQSGNVVFRAEDALAKRVAHLVADAIAEGFGLRVSVVTRTAEQIAQVARTNPFVNDAPDAKALHVAFLADTPSSSQLAALEPDRSLPDKFEVRGREVYLLCPNGVARTKLTNAYFDTKLGTISTARNWRTVLTLVEMTRRGP